jgi:hypothetical protein
MATLFAEPLFSGLKDLYEFVICAQVCGNTSARLTATQGDDDNDEGA